VAELYKTCLSIDGYKMKHVSLSFKNEKRQGLILDMGKLQKVAQGDFPDLDRLAIVVENAGNVNFPDQIGIGFDVPADMILPEGYTETIVQKLRLNSPR